MLQQATVLGATVLPPVQRRQLVELESARTGDRRRCTSRPRRVAAEAVEELGPVLGRAACGAELRLLVDVQREVDAGRHLVPLVGSQRPAGHRLLVAVLVVHRGGVVTGPPQSDAVAALRPGSGRRRHHAAVRSDARHLQGLLGGRVRRVVVCRQNVHPVRNPRPVGLGRDGRVADRAVVVGELETRGGDAAGLLLDRLHVFDGVVVLAGAEAGPEGAAGPAGGGAGRGRRRVQHCLALAGAQRRLVGVGKVQTQSALLLPVGDNRQELTRSPPIYVAPTHLYR